jgi:2-oxoglutarate ferredoxin oxidoreductase subunit alpha
MEHRIGGLGKQDVTGNVSYAPEDHEHIIRTRAQKIAGIADYIPELEVTGPEQGDLLVLGWGGTYGAIRAAVEHVQGEGLEVARAHLRHLNPLPRNLGNVLGRYKQILVPELNLGQLAFLLQGHFPVRVIKLNKVQGRPFQIREVADKIREVLR